MTVVMVLNATVDCCSLYMVQMLFCYYTIWFRIYFPCLTPLKIMCVLRSGASYGAKNTVYNSLLTVVWLFYVRSLVVQWLNFVIVFLLRFLLIKPFGYCRVKWLFNIIAVNFITIHFGWASKGITGRVWNAKELLLLTMQNEAPSSHL